MKIGVAGILPAQRAECTRQGVLAKKPPGAQRWTAEATGAHQTPGWSTIVPAAMAGVSGTLNFCTCVLWGATRSVHLGFMRFCSRLEKAARHTHFVQIMVHSGEYFVRGAPSRRQVRGGEVVHHPLSRWPRGRTRQEPASAWRLPVTVARAAYIDPLEVRLHRKLDSGHRHQGIILRRDLQQRASGVRSIWTSRLVAQNVTRVFLLDSAPASPHARRPGMPPHESSIP